ncbi:Pimeloyl-ACP methyl ester carboxylesterase [Noviherbaspirillum humi]|uniref:Pimeloyl-ACP methyl ester carboxylesterase n=1 Tax=Noviherbaspirillum humi TaxID=1688639 RepID=A0A239G7E4_9BURK|nr:alpha/beta hydrolase [Noviherbaspirillum humi]SNS64895.1 Pimeloyl-ACP methyl ester carboxylesterase [Noviherbaspirillum humi]
MILFSVILAIVIAAALTLLGLALFASMIEKKINQGFPPHGRFIDIDGTCIHYVDEGAGQPIVMVHGLNGQSRNFSHSLAGRLTGEYRVILIDRPGSGHSSPLASGSARIKHQGDLVAGVIRALQLERPLLVGHSLGGAISLSVALDHPDSIAALALVAPLTHFQEDVPTPFRALAIRSPGMRALFSRTLLLPLAILKRKETMDVVFGPEEAPIDFPTAGGGLMSLRPAAYLAAAADMQAIEHDLPGMMQRYPELSLPVGILYGTGDRILDWRRHGEAMRDKVKQLNLKTVEGGHMLPVTNPDATAEFIRAMAAEAEKARRETVARAS